MPITQLPPPASSRPHYLEKVTAVVVLLLLPGLVLKGRGAGQTCFDGGGKRLDAARPFQPRQRVFPTLQQNLGPLDDPPQPAYLAGVEGLLDYVRSSPNSASQSLSQVAGDLVIERVDCIPHKAN